MIKHLHWTDPADTSHVDGIEVFLYLGTTLIAQASVGLGVEHWATPDLGVGNYGADVATIWEVGNGHKHTETVRHVDFEIDGTNHTPNDTDSQIPPVDNLVADDN